MNAEIGAIRFLPSQGILTTISPISITLSRIPKLDATGDYLSIDESKRIDEL
jgi:hypothetical protein